MSDEQADTGEITQRFRAFASGTEEEPGRARRSMAVLLTTAALAAIVGLAAIVWFVVAVVAR